MTKKYTLSTFSLFISIISCLAQPAREPEDANEFYRVHNYLMALPIYKTLISKEPNNPDLNYRLGVCYLETHINRIESIKYFETALKDPKCIVDAWYYLGRAYHLNYKFDEAISAFEKYKELVPKNKEELDKTDRQIEMCNNAKTLMQFPRKVSFTNLGAEINTIYPDYFPWATDDDQILFYTSRRKGGHATTPESDGYFSSDVFVSTTNGITGKWDKAKNLGTTVNTGLDEEIVGINPDGKELVVYIDHIDQKEDLYTTVKKGNNFLKLEPLGSTINKEKEYSGSIANRETGAILFFVRREKINEGLTDIYMSHKLPNGNWGPAQNLGPTINTKYKEDFPWLSQDGKTLYFSSEGHNSMGGYDLFKSEWDEELQHFGQAENLGYPINTPDDDQQISILPDKRAGYLSALRPEGFGDLDIYRIKFEEEAQPFNLILGKLIPPDTVKVRLEATITAENEKTQEQFIFKPIPSSGKFIMALHPGKYKIVIECDGYKTINESVTIVEIGMQPYKETLKDYNLQKK